MQKVEMYSKMLEEHCLGCKEDQPNQLAHDLCLQSMEEKLDYLFPRMLEKIDIVENLLKEDLISDEQWVKLTKRYFLTKYFQQD